MRGVVCFVKVHVPELFCTSEIFLYDVRQVWKVAEVVLRKVISVVPIAKARSVISHGKNACKFSSKLEVLLLEG